MEFPCRAVLRIIGAIAAALSVCAVLTSAHAQSKPPIRIGLSIAQTGPLSSAGKSGLVAVETWGEDVNAGGGLLGRPVELVVYDDQSNPSMTPGIYAKLLDVDKVDLLVAPYGTNPSAPVIPLVKQRDLLLLGNFALDVNARIRHDKYFNNQPWASAKDGATPYLALCRKLGAKTIAILAADAEFAQNLAGGIRAGLKDYGLHPGYDPNYPPNTLEIYSLIRAIRAKKPESEFVSPHP